jgi:cytochrome c oxidase subunit 2
VSGAELFRSYGCSQCHGQTAPTLAGLYGRQVRLQGGATVNADDDYLRESILNPPVKLVEGYPPLMPSYRGQLNEEQVSDLVEYIKSLAVTRSDDGPAPDFAGPASRSINAYSPDRIRNVPPARNPPNVGETHE